MAKMEEIGGPMDATWPDMLGMADPINNGQASEMELHSTHMGINETEQKLEKVK